MKHMVMYVISGFFFIWLVMITWTVIKMRNHYLNLVSRTRKEKIDEVLDELLKTDQKIVGDIEIIKKELKEEVKKSQLHFQKIGLLRFNPFERVGGEQSFVISLLDYDNNGLILNFIYTREGLRVYTKKVKNGKGEEYELSDEEKKAIAKSNQKL